MADVLKDDCKICDVVLICVGLGLAGILTFMAVDLASDGKLSAMFSGATGKLASVTQLRGTEASGDSDAV